MPLRYYSIHRRRCCVAGINSIPRIDVSHYPDIFCNVKIIYTIANNACTNYLDVTRFFWQHYEMETKKIIDALGGCQAVANILNESIGLRVHSRQRIYNWYKSGKIPAWAQLAHPKVWAKGQRIIQKASK